tara:strand:- start:132 stop:326 length:195 start_codon:yes stop_codon:yes gene_type:complete
MKNKEYVVLEYEDKKRYNGEMYKIYTREKAALKYKMKLNREDYEKFILDIEIGNIKLYTSLVFS